MVTGTLWPLQGGQTGKGSSWESGRRGLPRTPGKMALPELGWLDRGWGEISSSDLNTTTPPCEDTQVWAPGKGLAEMSAPG